MSAAREYLVNFTCFITGFNRVIPKSLIGEFFTWSTLAGWQSVKLTAYKTLFIQIKLFYGNLEWQVITFAFHTSYHAIRKGSNSCRWFAYYIFFCGGSSGGTNAQSRDDDLVRLSNLNFFHSTRKRWLR
jgi:hypothetical protein